MTDDVVPHPGYHAYVDGRWWNGITTYGVVIICDDALIKEFKGRIPLDREGTGARQVVGELWSTMMATQWMIKHGVPEFWLHYDYSGIKEWYTEKWRARQRYAIEYVQFMNAVPLKVYFNKIKGHVGIYYNERADQLAREAYNEILSITVDSNDGALQNGNSSGV